MVNIKKRLGIEKPEESEEVKRRREEREAREKQEFRQSSVGKIVSKIQGRDPRLDAPLPSTTIPISSPSISGGGGGDPVVFTRTGGEIPSGVTIDGKTFLGLTPGDVKRVLQQKGTNIQQVQTAQVGRDALRQLGNIPQLNQAELLRELEGLSISDNFKQALAGVFAEGISGAGVGAGVGAIAGAPAGGIGAVPGAFLGAAAGFVTGLLTGVSKNLKAEAGEDRSAIGKEFKIIRTDFNKVITGVNTGDISQTDGVRMFNGLIAIIDREERQMKQLTSTDLQDYLSGGSDLMAQIRAFKTTELPILVSQLQGAIIQPDPTKTLTQSQLDFQLNL